MALKNIIISALAIIGFSIAFIMEFPKDPVRPYLLVVGILITVNINLQYFLGLNMGVTYPLAMPHESKKRNRLLIVSWFLIAFIIYGFVSL